jgi:4-aminobutyrate aminotransferase/(S)-3-amino-2-methylpropionate transaminase
MATPYFYKRLREIALTNKIPFVVDETKTGVGATGKMWGHEHWNLAQPADMVTFGGKAGISGFYSTVNFRLDSLNQQYSFEQNVDMVKLLNFGVTWKYI